MAEHVLTQIEVTFGQGEHRQLIAWPILSRTEKAWEIQTPGGILWMPIWRWQSLRRNSDKSLLGQTLELLADITISHRDARILVKKVGKGPSDKSVRVSFLIHRRAKWQSNWSTETFERSLTLATSLLNQDDPKAWSAPVWAVIKKLDANAEQLASRPFWPGLAVVTAQLQAAFDTVQSAQLVQQRQASEQAHAGWLIKEEARVKQASLDAELALTQQTSIETDGELALAFAKKRMTLSQMQAAGFHVSRWPNWRPGEPLDQFQKRDLLAIIGAATDHPEFSSWRAKNAHRQGALLQSPRPPKPRQPDRVICNATVEWTNWVGAKLRRVDQRAEGCAILVFGKKHEITLPDGTVFVKMEGPNLKILQSAPAVIEA